MTIIMFYHYSHYHVLNIIIIFTTIVIPHLPGEGC